MSRRWQRRRSPGLGVWIRPVLRWWLTVALTLGVLCTLGVLVWRVGLRAEAQLRAVRPAATMEAQQTADAQLRRIAAAIEVFHLREGRWPDQLDEVVDARLLSASDVAASGRRRSYHYRPAGAAYVLLPPAY